MNKSLILIIILLFPILLLGQNTRNPDYYCDLGIKFYEKGKYRDAAIEWEKALAISPNHQLANFYLVKATKEKNAIDFFAILGIKNYKQKNLEESLNNFNAIFEYDLNNEIATRYVNLINKDLDQNDELKANIINQFKKDAEQYQKKDDLISVKKGLALYNTLNLLNPGDTEVKQEKVKLEEKVPQAHKSDEINIYIQIGEEYLKEKKYDEAIFIWRKALLLDPNRSDLEEKIVSAFKLKVEKEKNEQIDKLMAQGIQYMNLGFNASAITIFEEILRLDPNNTQALDYRNKLLANKQKEEEKKNLDIQIQSYLDAGKLYFNKGQYEEAKKFFENVLTLDSENQEALNLLSQCEAQLQKQQEKIKQEEIEKIQKLLQEGLMNYKLGNFEIAISKLSECLALSPGNRFAIEYLDLAKKALWAKQEEEIDIKSPFYNMINNMIQRGRALFQKKDYEKSIDIWKSILFIFPLNKIAREFIVECSRFINPQLFAYFIQEHIDFGKKYLEQGLKDYALKEFELIKRLDPRHKGIDDLIRQAQPEEKKRPPADPKIITRYYQEGLNLYQAQKYEQAIQSWEKVLELEPGNERAILNINKVNQILNYDKIKEERVSNAAKDKKIEDNYLSGLKYYNNGDLQNAIKMWELVLQLDPDNIKAKNNIRTCKIILKSY